MRHADYPFFSSPRRFGFGFFQTPLHSDALAVSLTFGSTRAWSQNVRLCSNAPYSTHTLKLNGAPLAARVLERWIEWLGVASLAGV